MKNLKNICLIIGGALLLSASCFSQEVNKAQHNIRIITMVNPVSILRVHHSIVNPATTNEIVLSAENKMKLEKTNLSDENASLKEQRQLK